MFEARIEFHRVDVYVLMHQFCQVTAADIAMMLYFDRVVTRSLKRIDLENTPTEDRMLLRRSLTTVPLARNGVYAVHVMVWSPGSTRSIFPRFDAF